MFKKLIETISGREGIDEITYVEWALQQGRLSGILFLLLTAAIVFSVWSYYSFRDSKKGLRIFLGFMRALALCLVCILIFEPVLKIEYKKLTKKQVLILVDDSESMVLRDKRLTEPELEEAAQALGIYKVNGAYTEGDQNRLATASRMDLAKGILMKKEGGLIGSIDLEQHKLQVYRFNETLEPLSDDDMAKAVNDLTADGEYSALGSAVDEAVTRAGAESVAAVIVLSDFSWNHGIDPVGVAERLKDRGIPIYPIGIGRPEPPDLRVSNIYVKDKLFIKDRYTVKVQLWSSPKFAGRTAALNLTIGTEKRTRMVRLTGDFQIETFKMKAPKNAGKYALEIEIGNMDDEIITENNKDSRDIKVIDEKIKVLFVEGLPRWEYRYLRWVLLRDPRLDVKFLMTEGDKDLAAYSPLYLSRFPEAGKSGLDFDLMILGDVPATYFNHEQFRWIDGLVKGRGASLLMIAGKRHSPRSYRETPIADMLPVRIQNSEWKKVTARDRPVVTRSGESSELVNIGEDKLMTTKIFETILPLHSVPMVRKKASATVLMSLSNYRPEGELYPLIAWQRYGSGKCMFVGTEKLWRIRFQVGRRYHERLWAQLIQFLSLSRLEGGNERITLKTDSNRYAEGEQVQLFANVLDSLYEPVKKENYTVTVGRENGGDEEKVLLKPVPDVPGFYQGRYIPGNVGDYVMKAMVKDRKEANKVEFTVEKESLEMQNPGLQEELIRQLAEITGGLAALSGNEINTISQIINAPKKPQVENLTIELWDMTWIFIFLVIITAIEWICRRRERLV
ncbi:MAG: VWA domain-containing protein [Lentisphaeria bacterium]|nr:VWA domain-containing protein [Lentisphaeria bacterium]NQZ70245.1 VWA domain-containing protein [Lentisphaeria bacterium]